MRDPDRIIHILADTHKKEKGRQDIPPPFPQLPVKIHYNRGHSGDIFAVPLLQGCIFIHPYTAVSDIGRNLLVYLRRFACLFQGLSERKKTPSTADGKKQIHTGQETQIILDQPV
jgi:hypothetical protein